MSKVSQVGRGIERKEEDSSWEMENMNFSAIFVKCGS